MFPKDQHSIENAGEEDGKIASFIPDIHPEDEQQITISQKGDSSQSNSSKESMPKIIPRFIREFSKTHSAKERSEVAREIKAKRAEHSSIKKGKNDIRKALEDKVSRKTEEAREQLEQIERLKLTLLGLNSSLISRISEYFEIKKLKADLERGSKTYEQLLSERGNAVNEKEFLEAQLRRGDSHGKLQEGKNILQEFYLGQKNKWAESDYTKEDISTYFTENYLSSLALDDYALLLKRFPSNMVAHVTRQGIRDHFGHNEHSAGVGQYNDGFMQILKKGRLQSSLGIYLAEGLKEKAIEEFLNKGVGLNNFDSKEKALEWLSDFTAPEEKKRTFMRVGANYADRDAIHFATSEVADSYYGSERGNEIFFAFPSTHIASQYYFGGNLAEHGGGTWNDQWVWANEHRGISINAGLVFIPEDARVDSLSGSRYELDKDKRPVVDEEKMELLLQLLNLPQLETIIQDIRYASHDSELKNNIINSLRIMLSEKIGIIDERLQREIFTITSLEELSQAKNNNLDFRETVESILMRAGLLYREAKNPISSKDYWENYFEQHPEQKPSKLIYYKGGDPTAALHRWPANKGIKKTTDDPSIGFSEKQRDSYSPEATTDMDRFRSIATKVIENYFSR